MDQYPISSERSVNREVTVSLQLEVGSESFGVTIEELCRLSRMEVTVLIAKMTIRKHTYNHILVLANLLRKKHATR